MGYISLFLTGVGLSMDAFAAAICKGLNMRKLCLKQTFLIAFMFGLFQALMPLIGWFLGTQFEKYITNIDHWVAFGLLGFIGGKMIYESLKGGDDGEGKPFDLNELIVLAVATSIDALAVGITFALLPEVRIIPAITIIGLTTFALSAIGVFVGHKFGAKYKSKAELAGGIILVLIGAKILIEHTL